MWTAPGTICNAKPEKESFYQKGKSGIFAACLSFIVNCCKLSHVVNWFSTEYNHYQHLDKTSILLFLNLDSCDEKYHTPNSLRNCEYGLGDSKFLLKYHPSFPDPGVHCCTLLPCTAELGRGSTDFVGKYSHISRKSVSEAGDTPNLSWFRVDSLTVIYLGCHTAHFNWDIDTVLLDHIPQGSWNGKKNSRKKFCVFTPK